MTVLKWQSTQLSQARAIHQENLKKQRVDQKIVENYDTNNNKTNLS